jgi:protein SCO1
MTGLSRRRLLAAVAGAGALALTGCAQRGDDTSSGRFQGAEIDPPMPRPRFTLNTTQGERFDFFEQTRGRMTLMFFGYANCPDICPIHLANITQALEVQADLSATTTVVMASIDPVRDTPESLRRYLDGFDSRYVGLTGSKGELAAAQDAFGIARATEIDGDGRVSHSSAVFGFASDDLGYVQFPSQTRQSVYIHDLPVLAALGDPAGG